MNKIREVFVHLKKINTTSIRMARLSPKVVFFCSLLSGAYQINVDDKVRLSPRNSLKEELPHEYIHRLLFTVIDPSGSYRSRDVRGCEGRCVVRLGHWTAPPRCRRRRKTIAGVIVLLLVEIVGDVAQQRG